MMCRMGQGLPWAQCLVNYFQYLQPVVTLWTFYLCSEAIFPKKLNFKDFFCDFNFSFVFTKNACFLCALYSNVTVFCPLSLKKTEKKILWKRQCYTNLINEIVENNQSHKFGVNKTLCNLVIDCFPLSQRISIWTLLFVLLWSNAHLKLWYVYLFPPMILV